MAKAMSVAVGMPQPFAAAVPPLKSANTAAGASMPPAAASTGRMALRTVESWPQTISRLISRPTQKKKITISPSFTSFSTVIPCGNTQSITPLGLFTTSDRSVSSNPRYTSAVAGMLASSMATTTHTSSTSPPAQGAFIRPRPRNAVRWRVRTQPYIENSLMVLRY